MKFDWQKFLVELIRLVAACLSGGFTAYTLM